MKLFSYYLLYIVTEADTSSSSGISTGALAGIVIGAIACSVTLSSIVAILILRTRLRDYRTLSKRRNGEYIIENQNLLSYYIIFSLQFIIS